MRYTLITALALSLTLPAFTMEVQQFQNIFRDTRKAVSPMSGYVYFETINNTFKEAENKKEALLQLQLAITQLKANGIPNHILIYGKTADTIDLNDEALNRTFKNLITNHAKTLVELLNYYETLCKADILKVELALETKIGMCSDCSDSAKIIQNTQLPAIEAYWKNTHKNLDLMQLTDNERKFLELLVRKEPVPIEDFKEPIVAISAQGTK